MQSNSRRLRFNHVKTDPGIIRLLFSLSGMSDSLWPQGRQQAKLPCPSPSPGACSNSCPLSQWCHPTISPSVAPFSYCLWSFPASGPFLMSQFFASHGQWLVWSPCSPRDSQESTATPQFKNINSLALSLLYGPTLTSTHDYWKKP